MEFNLDQLLGYLHVDTSENENHFIGRNLPGKRRAVFGGQIIAQALDATMQTVTDDRFPHSLHCHFLRPGKTDLPIEYEVAVLRDGGSFSLRQVTAVQAHKPIFMMMVSYQKPEQGLQHQQPAPEMTPRSEMITEYESWQRLNKEMPELNYLRPDNFTALDILSRFRAGVKSPPAQAPQQSFWFKANGVITSERDHLLIIAFQSDLQFLNTGLHAHPYTFFNPDVHAASLDHSLWFYRPVNTCEWLYYDMHSPISASGRGLNHGYLYTEAGELVAATTQEGLMRVKDA